MQQVDTIFEGIQTLVTLAGEGPLLGQALGEWDTIGDAAIAVKDGRIVQAGTRASIHQLHKAERNVDLNARLVTPGLVDCHTHPAWVVSRAGEFELRLQGASYEEILAAGGGIHQSVSALRESTQEALNLKACEHLAALQAHGVVAAECKSGYGLSLEHELSSLRAIKYAGEKQGMRVKATCLAAHVVPQEYKGRKAEYVDLVCKEILPAVVGEGLADAADIFVEEGAFDGEDARRVIFAAHELGMRVHVHADQLNPGMGAKIAAELQAASADHLEYTDEETMDAMAAAGTFAVMLPGSTFVLKQESWANARAFVDRNVPLALASDFNPGSSPIPNPAFIMTLAVMHMGLSANEALAAFTRNAACCLGIDADYGSLQPGRKAALALWELDEVREIPYYAGSNMVRRVVVEQ